MLMGLMLRMKKNYFFLVFFNVFKIFVKIWYSCIMKSTRELEAPGRPVARGGGAGTPSHAKMVRLVEYRYLIISTRAGWHMIKFKIHALECTRTRHFYVKNSKIFIFLGGGPPQTHPPAGGGHPCCTPSAPAAPRPSCLRRSLTHPFSEVWLWACQGGLQLSSAGTDTQTGITIVVPCYEVNHRHCI